jgi:hypothetical protein
VRYGHGSGRWPPSPGRTHHKVRTDATMLDRIREEVSADFQGRLITGHDLTEIEF